MSTGTWRQWVVRPAFVCLALLAADLQAGPVSSASCGSDRPALIGGALFEEIRELLSRRDLACVVVAISTGVLSDPPDSAVFSLKRRSRVKVVPLSKAQTCPGAPVIWATEPRCDGKGHADVQTESAVPCPRSFKKERDKWVYQLPGPCE